MFRHSIKIRFLALFVVAFICLNAGGAMCVAYCRGTEAVEPESDHCPLEKLEEHFDRAGDEKRSAVVRTSEIDCCPMTVSFFAAPLEQVTFKFQAAASAAVSVSYEHPTRPRSQVRSVEIIPYRGPPLLDCRTDRIKYRLLRI